MKTPCILPQNIFMSSHSYTTYGTMYLAKSKCGSRYCNTLCSMQAVPTVEDQLGFHPLPRQTQHCGFSALRFPAGFTPRFMRPIGLGVLSGDSSTGHDNRHGGPVQYRATIAYHREGKSRHERLRQKLCKQTLSTKEYMNVIKGALAAEQTTE